MSISELSICGQSPEARGFSSAIERQRRYTEGMEKAEIQIVSNEAGEPTAVIVPIDLWREIESERESAYLLKSETMKQRLLAAKERREGISLEAVVEKLGI
jgi:antitoxin YefM